MLRKSVLRVVSSKNESIGDIIPGIERPLAPEIGIRPFSTIEKRL